MLLFSRSILVLLLLFAGCLSVTGEYQKAQTSFAAGQMKRAEGFLKEGIAKYPTELKLYDLLARVYHKERRYRTALRFFRKQMKRPVVRQTWWVRKRIATHLATFAKGEPQREEFLLFQKISVTMDQSLMTTYLKRYPQGAYATKVREMDLFVSARSEGTIGALKLYLKRYPKGQFAREAHRTINQLQAKGKRERPREARRLRRSKRREARKRARLQRRAKRIVRRFSRPCRKHRTRFCLRLLLVLRSKKLDQHTPETDATLKRVWSFLSLAQKEKTRRSAGGKTASARPGTTLALGWRVLSQYRQRIQTLKRQGAFRTAKTTRMFRIKICCLRPPYMIDCKAYSRIAFVRGNTCVSIKQTLSAASPTLQEDALLCKRVRFPQPAISSCLRVQ